MSKKSAVSKGYRKTVKKKPFLSKKEIIAVIAILAAIILAIVLFNLFYDDGYLGENEVQAGDIVAYANQDVHSRYAKLGVANELEGFTRTDQGSSTNKLVSYYYSPEAEADQIDFINVYGIVASADVLSDSVLNNYVAAGVDASERYETTVQGYDAYILGANVSSYDPDLDVEAQDEASESEADSDVEIADAEDGAAEAVAAEETIEGEAAATGEEGEETTEAEEENAPNSFSQSLSCYVAVDESHTLCFQIYRVGEEESFYLPDDQLVDFMLSYSDAFTLVEPKA